MRAIAVGQDGEAEFAIAIAKQEGGVTGNTAAVRDITIAVPHLRPPCQTEAGAFIAPNAFNSSLACEHLLQSLFGTVEVPQGPGLGFEVDLD